MNEKNVDFKMLIFAGAAVLLVGTAIFCTLALTGKINVFESKEGEVSAVSSSMLEGVIKKAELYTVEYPYNSYTQVKDNYGNVKYYVAYEGKVKAGIDTEKIVIDSADNVITVKIPKINYEWQISENLDFIFKNSFLNTETVRFEGREAALSDLEKKVKNDTVFKQTAYENTEKSVRALIEPIIDNSYTLNIINEETENTHTTEINTINIIQEEE